MCAGVDLYSCIELLGWHGVVHTEGIGIAELKAAEDWPVRDASPCPRRAARGATAPEPTEPTPLPLSTSLTILLAATSVQVLWPMYAGVEASEEAARGSHRRRSASTRVLRCCVQPGRAAVAGTT